MSVIKCLLMNPLHANNIKKCIKVKVKCRQRVSQKLSNSNWVEKSQHKGMASVYFQGCFVMLNDINVCQQKKPNLLNYRR